ncbi:capsular biosynthesis protein [Pandoraea terrigena]|uniref:Capsular biosynthesis protein n=2 Tax=Pandoraea terrigena TaxID=2508292 RepID=A0A5E4VVS9_9BURK|nr:capsular biosynthesis protein [Pandoraea terrigena]
MLKFVTNLPRTAKSLVLVCMDALLLPFALWAAIGLRLDVWRFPQIYSWWVYPIVSIVAIPIFVRLGLYRAVIRYIEARAMTMVVVAVTVAVCLFAAVLVFLTLPPVPRGAMLIYWMMATLFIGGSRFLARAVLQKTASSNLKHDRQSVVIYGAGSSGRQLAVALRAGRDFQPVAFVDDSTALQGMQIVGLKTYAPDDLPRLVERFAIRQVLLAIPSAGRSRRLQIINQLEPLKVEVRVIPGMSDLVDGVVKAEDIREVEIDDLLGREIVPPQQDLLKANILGKHVMVTGAGGSIGSELCRQIVLGRPATLVLYEQSEFALYSIEQELEAIITNKRLGVRLMSVLGSVRDEARLCDVMMSCGIQTVYHAAAYKHVPIVEFNMTEGILNNVFGTLATARAAIASEVEIMVLISTDKAVRPTNIMGASKRFAELVLQAYANDPAVQTRFCMVRFGNVLGSSGSVVPLFRKQILGGGPVTVTHPDITRYFMTIPEASQLVIQAGAMSQGGEVFVLNMGEPVKISDLARRMIHLSGFSVKDDVSPDGDIEIRFSGLRPGEKLYEELLIGDDVAGTRHPKIMMATEHFFARDKLSLIITRLFEACEKNNHDEIVLILHECVSGFRMVNEIRDHLYGLNASQLRSAGGAATIH